MAFTPKDWIDAPSTATPISAAALEDLETRVAAYADSQIAASAEFATTAAGNLGAAHTTTFGAETFRVVTGTLDANHVETVAGRAAGKIMLLRVQQDATGSRTLAISDGTTSQAVTINATASAPTDVLVLCPNSTDIDVAVLGGAGGGTLTESDPLAVLKSIIDAAGDLIVGTADNTAGRLAKGADGTLLSVVAGTLGYNTLSTLGIQATSEKAQVNGYASLGSGGRVPIAQLASGTPDGTKFVRDDGTLAVPAGGGGGAATGSWRTTAGLITPVMWPVIGSSTAPAASANLRLWLARAVCPKAGTISGLWVYNGATVSGNVIGAIFDTSATRNRLWTGSSAAQAGTQAWQSLGNPAITVTEGQEIELGFLVDNGTGTYGRFSFAASHTAQVLPSAFDNGAAAKLSSAATLASFAVPSTVLETDLSGLGAVPQIIAKVA